jgi:predicted GTPase
MRTEWLGKVFDIVDTGGLVFEDDAELLFIDEIKQQV